MHSHSTLKTIPTIPDSRPKWAKSIPVFRFQIIAFAFLDYKQISSRKSVQLCRYTLFMIRTDSLTKLYIPLYLGQTPVKLYTLLRMERTITIPYMSP